MNPRRCHVAVVGAGAIGLAVALQLKRASVPEVLVIDQHSSPGMGSTSRANGGVRAQFTTAVNIAFSQYTIAGLRELDRATGGLPGLRPVGYLFMTGTPARAEQLRRGFELQRQCGVNVEWLNRDGVLAIAPFVRAEGLMGGTFCPSDGIIDPGGVVQALCTEGRRLGVEYLFNRTVTAIDLADETVGIGTPGGDVRADIVVNAAGPFAGELAAMAGVGLPVLPYRRNLACTEPAAGFPDAIPMCIDTDTGLLIRREAGGFLVAYSDPSDVPSWDTAFDPSFLEAIALRASNRFPFLESIPINERKCWAGLYPETPDHHAIIDGAPDGRFIHCAGFGGHGIMHSLAAGQAVTELITKQHGVTFDLEPLRLSRFAEGELRMESAVL